MDAACSSSDQHNIEDDPIVSESLLLLDFPELALSNFLASSRATLEAARDETGLVEAGISLRTNEGDNSPSAVNLDAALEEAGLQGEVKQIYRNYASVNTSESTSGSDALNVEQQDAGTSPNTPSIELTGLESASPIATFNNLFKFKGYRDTPYGVNLLLKAPSTAFNSMEETHSVNYGMNLAEATATSKQNRATVEGYTRECIRFETYHG